MKISAGVKSRFLGILAALLILIQSLFAMGLPDVAFKDSGPKKTEVQQQVAPKVKYTDISSRLTLVPFLFYWIARDYTFVEVALIQYRNCKALLVNPFSFNVYYAFTSALAP